MMSDRNKLWSIIRESDRINRRLRRAPRLRRAGTIALAIGAAAGLTAIRHANASVLTWDANTTTTGAQDGAGTWNANSTANWWNGTADVVWPASDTTDTALFGVGGTVGTVTISGSVSANSVVFNTATYVITGGTNLTLGGTSPSIVTNVAGTINSSIVLSAANTVFNTPATLTLGGAISGSGSVTKQGGGFLTFNGVNSFNGFTSTSGSVQMGAAPTTTTNSAIGGGFFNVSAGITLNNTLTATAIELVNNPTAWGTGTDTFFSAGNTQYLNLGTGNATLTGNPTFNVANSGTTVFGGNISGASFGFNQGNTGILVLNGNNTFGGPITLVNGILRFASVNSLGSGSSITLNGGTLQFGIGNTADISGKTITINGGGGTIDTYGNNVTLANSIGNSGAGGLNKNGLGTLSLGAAETYTGTTSINAGTLDLGINGSVASTAMNIGSGTLNIGGTGANETFSSGTTLTGGAIINAGYSNGNTLVLGNITRFNSGTVNVNLPSTGSVTTSTGNSSTIIGGYATVNGTDWAVSNSGSLAALGTYGGFASGADVDVPTGASAPGSMTINSLRFNTPGASVVDDGNGDILTISSGGILVTPNAGAVTISPVGLGSGTGELIINQFNTTAATNISSAIISGAVTKAGPGTLILSGFNAFAGGLTINGGEVDFSSNTSIGAVTAGNKIIFNGGTLSYTAPSNYTEARTLNFNAGGGTLNLVESGANGGGAKMILSTANQITGNGTITVTGRGILTMTAGNTYAGATTGWILNGGFVETSSATALGAVTVPVTINTGGEWDNKGIVDGHNVVLNGGTIGNDSGTADTFGGQLTVTTASKIRLGDFYDGTNRNINITGPIQGSGNLSLINANSVAGPSDSNPTGTPGAGTLSVLSLAGNDMNYTGTLITDSGHDVRFQNTVAYLKLQTKSTTTALPLVTVQTSAFSIPNITDDPTGTGEGVFGVTGTGINSAQAVNMNNVADGNWFFGCDSLGTSYFGVLTPGTGNVYRLTGGGGSLFIGSAATLSSAGTGGAIIGDTRLGGTGVVRLGAAATYSGTTTVNAGSTLSMDFVNATPTTNLMPVGTNLNLAGGTFTNSGKNNTNLSQGMVALNLQPGAASVTAVNTATANNILFNLGVINRSTGSTVNFTNPANGTLSPTLNGIVTNTPNAYGTILGGYATVGGNTWATSAGTSGTAGLITGLTTYGATPFAAGSDTDAAPDSVAGPTTPGSVSINSLRFNSSGGYTISDSGSGDTLTIASGGILETSGVSANSVLISAANLATSNGSDLIVIQNNTAGPMAINSSIGSSIGLTKSGAGVLSLGASNTYTGNTYDNAGTLLINNPAALNNSTVVFNLQAGALQFGPSITAAQVGGLSGNQAVALTNTNGTPAAVSLTVGRSITNSSSTYSGNLTGLGGLTKAGTGTFTLSGAESYVGPTLVNAGTLRVTGNLGGSGSVSVASGATLAGTGTISVPVTVAGGSTQATQGSASLIDGSIGTLTINNSLTVGDASNPANLGFDINATTSDMLALGSNVFTVNAGGASVRVNSLVPGTSIASGTTYTLMTFGSGAGAGFQTGIGTTVGAITLADPRLTFGVSGTLNVSSTSLSLVTSVATAPPVAYWSGVQGNTWAATDATLSFGNFTTDPAGMNFVNAYPASNTDVFFAANGNGAPTNLTNTLGQVFDIHSLTFLSGLAATNIGGTQQLTIEGGGITEQSGAGPVTLGMTNLVLGSSQTWNNSAATPLFVSSNVSGNAALTTTGNIIMTGLSNYSGGLTITSGTLQFGGTGSLNTAGSLTVNGTLDANGSNITAGTLSGSGTITNGPAAAGNVTLTTNVTADSTFSGPITDNGTGKALTLVKNGPSSLTLSGNNAYSNGTTINGGTLVAGTPTAFGSGSLNTTGGSTVDLNAAGNNTGGANTVSIGSLSGLSGTTITDRNPNAGLTSLNVNQTTTGNFGGAIIDGSNRPIALNKTGSAALVLTNTGNNYSGGTTIAAGTITSQAPGTIGSGQVTLSGGTLSLGQSLSGFGSNGSGWTLNQAGTYTTTPITNDVVTLTDGANNQGRWAFFSTPQSIVNANGFTANFTYTASGNKAADGVAFVIENDPRGANIVNGTGGSLGYNGTADSGAVVFNLFGTSGPVSQTGFDTNGTNAASGTSVTPVDFHTGDPINVSLSYNGSSNSLTETLNDAVASTTFTTSYSDVDFNSLLGGTTGYVGFSGSTGGSNSVQTVSNFNFQSGAPLIWGNNILASTRTNSKLQLGAGAASVGSLTLQNGSSVSVASINAQRQLLSVASLNLSGGTGAWTSTVDLQSNALDVRGGSLTTITNQLKQGYANGTWQGSGGIVSSAAASDATHLTALGAILNTTDGTTPLYASINGTPLAATDVLVKYTYYGDANLDGSVNSADYALIDNGYLSHLTGWYNGDFNYDGTVNGSDYTLIDNAFNMQGASLSTQIASATAQVAGSGTSSAVPEPASGLMLGLGVIALLGRRRRR